MPDRLRPFTALSTDASGTTSASGFRYVRDVVILFFFFYTSEMHICYLVGSSGLSFFFFFNRWQFSNNQAKYWNKNFVTQLE